MSRKSGVTIVTQDYLNRVRYFVEQNGWQESKWVQFCQRMVSEGFSVWLYCSKSTKSKYVYVESRQKSLKIRFSNHPPTQTKEDSADSDYYVGPRNNGNYIASEEVSRLVIDSLRKAETV